MCSESVENEPLCMITHITTNNVLSTIQNQQSVVTSRHNQDGLLSSIPAICPNATSCGHLAHRSCIERHKATMRQQQASFSFVNNKERGEFTCPMCRSLSNAVVPYLSMKQCLTGNSDAWPLSKQDTSVDNVRWEGMSKTIDTDEMDKYNIELMKYCREIEGVTQAFSSGTFKSMRLR